MHSRQCALVSGGSRGIGRATAVRLARDGYDVAFCSRSDGPAAAETRELLGALGCRYVHAVCDVSDYEDVKEFVKRAEAELSPISVLVNSAGIVRDNPLALMPVEDWLVVIDTNLNGTFNVCKATVFGMMKRRTGSVINVSSVAGVYGHATQANYSASKAGIHGLSKALAKELARFGIRVNVVAPGFIDTDMTAGLSDTARQQALEAIPLGRFGTADSVAEMISYLASDRASYVTGQILQIDGGMTL